MKMQKHQFQKAFDFIKSKLDVNDPDIAWNLREIGIFVGQNQGWYSEQEVKDIQNALLSDIDNLEMHFDAIRIQINEIQQIVYNFIDPQSQQGINIYKKAAYIRRWRLINSIQKYQLLESYKNHNFEVIQWEVSMRSLEEIKDFVKFPFSIEFKESQNLIILKCSWGQFPVKAWDYVVKIDDYYLGIDCTFFNILFKRVKEQQ